MYFIIIIIIRKYNNDHNNFTILHSNLFCVCEFSFGVTETRSGLHQVHLERDDCWWVCEAMEREKYDQESWLHTLDRGWCPTHSAFGPQTELASMPQLNARKQFIHSVEFSSQLIASAEINRCFTTWRTQKPRWTSSRVSSAKMGSYSSSWCLVS